MSDIRQRKKKYKAKSCRQNPSSQSLMFPSPSGGCFRTRSLPFFWKTKHRKTHLWERKEIPDPQLQLCRSGPSLGKEKHVSLEAVQQNSTCYMIYISADKHVHRMGKINYVACKAQQPEAGKLTEAEGKELVLMLANQMSQK